MKPTVVTKFRMAAVAALAFGVASCSFTGVNDRPLPFAKGGGDGAMTISVTLDSAENLTPNSEVKVADVTVGSIRSIEFKGWKADITVGLEPGVTLPANVNARVGQTSLLGAQYLELAPPAKAAKTPLADGDIIPSERTTAAPDTEKVLTAAGILLGGGGLENVASITAELNEALGGNEQQLRSLIKRLDVLVSRVNAQRTDLVAVIDSTNQLSGTFARQRKTIATALDTIPEGLTVLSEEQKTIQSALDSVSDLGDSASPFITQNQADLKGTLSDLATALQGVAGAGEDLPKALGLATIPIPLDSAPNLVRGDYGNLSLNLDLTQPTLEKNFLSGTPLEGLLGGLNPDNELSGESQNPLLAPLKLPGQAPTPDPTLPLVPTLPGEGAEPSPAPDSGGVLGGFLDLLRPDGAR